MALIACNYNTHSHDIVSADTIAVEASVDYSMQNVRLNRSAESTESTTETEALETL